MHLLAAGPSLSVALIECATESKDTLNAEQVAPHITLAQVQSESACFSHSIHKMSRCFDTIDKIIDGKKLVRAMRVAVRIAKAHHN